MLRRWLALGCGMVLLCLTTACGSSGARPAAAKASGATAPSSCSSGGAAQGVILPAVGQPDAGVDKPTGTCWAKIAPTPITNVTFGSAPPGSSASVRVAWSSKALYVLCSVKAWPLHAAAPASTWWQNDACEFYVSGSNAHSGSYGAHDGQIGLVYSGGLYAGPNSKVTLGALKGVANVRAKKGYDALLIVPWSALGVTHPAKGQSYQFDEAVDYGSSTGKYVGQLSWTGTGLFGNTKAWGAVTLR